MYTLRAQASLPWAERGKYGVYWAKPKIDAIILENCTGKSSRPFVGEQNTSWWQKIRAPFAFVESKLNQILKEFNSGPCYAPN